MNVPFIDLKAQYISIKQEIRASIDEILETSDFTRGKAVSNFETAFSRLIGPKHCLGVGSGTDALHLALKAIDVKNGDEIITTPMSFFATTESILMCGAKPIFVDVEELTANICVSRIEEKINKKTKAILPVHLFGHPCDISTISLLRKKYIDLYLIEDACQAHLASCNGKNVGMFGDLACFSFYPGKNLGAYGEAGAVVTDRDDYYDTMKGLNDHGQFEKYHHLMQGYNYRMDGIQGAVLNTKLNYLDRWTTLRRINARFYNERLKDVSQILLPTEMSYAKHVYHLYVIRTNRRDELKEFLQTKGISTGLHYPIPIHLMPPLTKFGYKVGDFPVAESWAKQGLSLPMFPELTEDQISYVCDSILEFFKN